MTINQGPDLPALRPIGPPKAEAIHQYTMQAYMFEDRGYAADKEQAIILNGLFFFTLDLIKILDTAGQAEMRDPEPVCGLPLGSTHCTEIWRHQGIHKP